ncbi:Protein KlaB, partial [Symbiodinium microadriaticum]
MSTSLIARQLPAFVNDAIGVVSFGPKLLSHSDDILDFNGNKMTLEEAMKSGSEDTKISETSALLVKHLEACDPAVYFKRKTGFLSRIWDALTGSKETRMIEFTMNCRRVDRLVAQAPLILEQAQKGVHILLALEQIYTRDIEALDAYIQEGRAFIAQYRESGEGLSDQLEYGLTRLAQRILNLEVTKASSEMNKVQVAAVANTLVLGDPRSAHNFGRSKSPDGAYLDKLLENVHVYNQGKDGKRLNEIVELARDISTSVQPVKVQQLLLKIPVLGYYATRALRLAHRANDRFDNVKNQVSLLTEDITSISTDLIGHNNNLDILYEEVLAEVHESGINIVAAGFAIEHIEATLKQRRKALKSDPENNLLALEVSNIDHQLAVLKKRKVDIIMTQQKCFEDLTMIRMMQRNNLNML